MSWLRAKAKNCIFHVCFGELMEGKGSTWMLLHIYKNTCYLS